MAEDCRLSGSLRPIGWSRTRVWALLLQCGFRPALTCYGCSVWWR